MFPLAVFSWIDWTILFTYMALVVAIGAWAGRRKTDAEGYFLAGRTMPTWAVALSIIATTLSVATFVGAPQESFKGDLTYLSLNLGGFLGTFIVALFFVPRLYRAGTVTIYGYIGQRFGDEARAAMSVMFLFGRLLASGVRLFIAAIPVCLLLFSGQEQPLATANLVLAICLIGVIGTAYTISGGIRAVIWTDTLQITVVFGTALLSIALLLSRIPLPVGEILGILGTAGEDGASKLRLFNTTLDATSPYTLWTALIGNTVLIVAVYGTDHDMAQRMMTARSPMRGALSLIVAQGLNLIVVSLFMALGLLLYIFYSRPDIMGAATPADQPTSDMAVYTQFLLRHMPVGLAGLAMAGLFAAAQGSLDSAINAMASSAVADLYWPLRRRLGWPVDIGGRTPRLAVILIGGLLIGFAIVSALAYDPQRRTLINFALGVMSFAYTGMLGVFLAAMCTRRGNTTSILAALLTGIVVTTLLQDGILAWWSTRLLGQPLRLAFLWWLPIGVAASFLVCVAGAPPSRRLSN